MRKINFKYLILFLILLTNEVFACNIKFRNILIHFLSLRYILIRNEEIMGSKGFLGFTKMEKMCKFPLYFLLFLFNIIVQ